jgi:excisionase family DNA binding protein
MFVANIAYIAFACEEMPTMPPTAKHAPNQSQNSEKDKVLISDEERQEIERLYDAMRRGKAKLVSSDGQARLLPQSLYSFLNELIGLLNEGKPVYIVQNQANLTTVEAAAMLGVSRQFLVNILERGEIPYHLVGTHRRIYSQDLLAYKSRRDQNRRETLRDLAQEEVAEGLYGRIPAAGDAD